MSPREETSNGSAVAAQPSQSDDATRQLKNRPKATALRQQQLPAWQPILTASTVIPTVFGVGVIFIPIGIALFLASDGVIEHSVTYEGESDAGGCGAIGAACTINVDVKQMDGDVYFYYQLDNYYQNHRRYVKSRNDMQYLGNLDSISECEPYAKKGDQFIVPCGAIANSMFNDTFKLLDPVTMVAVPFTEEGVLWDVDTQRKFKNPDTYTPGMDVNACKNGPFRNTASPPNWGSKHICDLPNALQNTDLIVWMRTAALPSFRKLYRKLDRSHAKYANGLPAGRYQLVIQNNYPVASFDGVKRFVMSTTSWAGGKNSFLGIAYLVVGCLAFLLGVVFVVIHYKFGHSLSELGNVPEPHS